MDSKLTTRVYLIGNILRFCERYFFEPKLKKSLLAAQKVSNINHKFWSSEEEIVCFDIGANRGQTIRLFKEIFPNCKIYAFEPDPNIFRKYLFNLKLRQVKCINLAVGNLNGKFPFWVSMLDETSTLSLPNLKSTWNNKKALILGTNPQEMYKKITVEVITLDKFVLQHRIQKINVLKIDVKGTELQVLLGGKSTFQEDKVSIVQFESHKDDLRLSQDSDIERFLTEFGFFEYSRIKHSFGNFYEKIYVKQS